MEPRTAPRDPHRSIGVAGRCATDEEKAYVKQAVFLLRFRMRFLDAWEPATPVPVDP